MKLGKRGQAAIVIAIMLGLLLALVALMLMPFRSFEVLSKGVSKRTRIVGQGEDYVELEMCYSWTERVYVDDSGWDPVISERTYHLTYDIKQHPDIRAWLEQNYTVLHISDITLSFKYSLSGGEGFIHVEAFGELVDEIRISGQVSDEVEYDLYELGEVPTSVLDLYFWLQAAAPAFGSTVLECTDITMCFKVMLKKIQWMEGEASLTVVVGFKAGDAYITGYDWVIIRLYADGSLVAEQNAYEYIAYYRADFSNIPYGEYTVEAVCPDGSGTSTVVVDEPEEWHRFDVNVGYASWVVVAGAATLVAVAILAWAIRARPRRGSKR